MIIFSDGDFANDCLDRRSITGTIITINGSPISWMSLKQSAVAMSTEDAEYRAITTALQNGILLKRIIENLPILRRKLNVRALTDNQPALGMVHSIGGTKRSKFIALRHNFLQHEIKKHNIGYAHTPSSKMRADICTKPLTRD